MKEFFGDVGEGYAAGVWEDTPKDRAGVPRALQRSSSKPQAKKRKAEEMV